MTRQRMYLETMEEILSRPGMDKILLPEGTAGQTLPLLPLMQKSEAPRPAVRPQVDNVPTLSMPKGE